MKIGLIGVGTVGGTLKKYLEEHTQHEVKCFDPGKQMNDSLEGCDAIFISVPVPPSSRGQDHTHLREAVKMAKKHTKEVYIRSTVLPGTNDLYGTIACPEFLTERRAYEDMTKLPIIVGKKSRMAKQIFTDKLIYYAENKECELAKFAHNCFGAMKVTYFNLIERICAVHGLDYNDVRNLSFITGFIEPDHTDVPGHDKQYGFGGHCFPENVKAFKAFLQTSSDSSVQLSANIMGTIETLNHFFRYGARPSNSVRELEQ